MKNVCAVIFDLKKSRSLANRAQVQATLIAAIKQYNVDHESQIVAPFLIIVGDEWQGLLRDDSYYREAIAFFETKLQLSFYVGIGVGDCTVQIEELTVNQLDGPAFHKARDALRYAKANGYTEIYIR